MRTLYKPNVLNNEFPVFRGELERLFEKHDVYVFGYGSLLCKAGWHNRGIYYTPQKHDFIECVLDGYERGPWGMFGEINFYGVVKNKRKRVNGVIVKIHDIFDWIALMRSEYVAGLSEKVNYRVVDVTRSIKNTPELPDNVVIHCVCNRPINRNLVLDTRPARSYYDNVWKLVCKGRSERFVTQFLKTGGFKSNKEVDAFIKNMTQKNVKR